jgi:hypothetical protein
VHLEVHYPTRESDAILAQYNFFANTPTALMVQPTFGRPVLTEI